jgi:hypothetical protein
LERRPFYLLLACSMFLSSGFGVEVQRCYSCGAGYFETAK